MNLMGLAERGFPTLLLFTRAIGLCDESELSRGMSDASVTILVLHMAQALVDERG